MLPPTQILPDPKLVSVSHMTRSSVQTFKGLDTVLLVQDIFLWDLTICHENILGSVTLNSDVLDFKIQRHRGLLNEFIFVKYTSVSVSGKQDVVKHRTPSYLGIWVRGQLCC